MNVRIELRTSNLAFEVHPGNELCRILRDLSQVVLTQYETDITGLDGYHLLDSNGNGVGKVTITKEVN